MCKMMNEQSTSSKDCYVSKLAFSNQLSVKVLHFLLPSIPGSPGTTLLSSSQKVHTMKQHRGMVPYSGRFGSPQSVHRAKPTCSKFFFRWLAMVDDGVGCRNCYARKHAENGSFFAFGHEIQLDRQKMRHAVQALSLSVGQKPARRELPEMRCAVSICMVTTGYWIPMIVPTISTNNGLFFLQLAVTTPKTFSAVDVIRFFV